MEYKMAELKGKYAPYFHLIVDSNTNKKTLKCKLCSSGSTLTYHGNTSVMKSHLEVYPSLSLVLDSKMSRYNVRAVLI